ncbi:MAG: TrkA family potassium uptake protein [Thermotogae bacterium]|uniref:TrkA family potassium uptake protein n=1 Tax=Kosmotoga arenicorallina TaxID=688066 RepID=A0A7C5DUK8_9BACT|nr:TrkA family potassium uptake protein [Kosmotoga sp.]MBO8167064.1 TrkA family potassium uptake protein [Kosmotoga sp.]MCD6159576.1 TrkA family potassium uptake protein [Kosmotoga sp.]RKX50145.1 MAG: TrkA family potassium uptake protein [Thermotogota bacterium]HHF08144.1 TrkA family potassium uptake protein [Kosmotoga arenicorallina]
MPVLNKKKSKGLYIVIFGCGRLGSGIANWLSSKGNSVVVVDRREEAFSSLSFEFTGFTIIGDATELDTLETAKVEKADVVLALTPDDNTNIMTALISKEYFEVPRVIARVYDPNNIDMFSEFGVEIICPTLLAVKEIQNTLGFIGGDEG